MVVYEVPSLDKKIYPIVLLPIRNLEKTFLGPSPQLIKRIDLWCVDELGNNCNLYSGPIMAVAVDEPFNAYPADEAPYEAACPEESASVLSLGSNDIDQMPIIIAGSSPTSLYNQSKVWIDPIRSPFVYNHYDASVNQSNPINQSNNYILVQNNVTQIINAGQLENTYELSRPKRTQRNKPVYEEFEDYYDDDSESDQYIPELRRKKKRFSPRNKVSSDKNGGKALKQLLSTESTCKQRKTILFLGKDSKTGHTIQNISYDDPMIKCSEIDVDHEVTIENSPWPNEPKKKKFQCDKCKQIFEQISSFHQHIKGKHAIPKTNRDKKEVLRCNDCNRNFKTYHKYQQHCLGHGDPNVECPKCLKAYSSSATLKVHMKIHDRKYPCSYCTRSYATAQTYKTHMKKSHSKFLCEYDTCSFVGSSETVLNDHLSDHIYTMNTQIEEIRDQAIQDQVTIDEEILDQNVEEDQQIQDQQVQEELIIQDNNAQRETIVFLENNTNDFKDINPTQDISEYIDHMELEQISKSNVSDLAEEFPDDFSDVDFEQDSVLMDDIKNEMETSNFSEPKGVEDRERIREADSVIAKIMSNKIFLLDSKKAKKYAKKSKSNKTCTCCTKSFDRVTDLKRHLIEHMVKSTLTKTVSSAQGFLDLLCEVCQEESFDSVDKYKAHLRMHAQLTTYTCTLCDKSFSDSSNFSKHKKIHGVSYYQCDLCKRRFNSKIMLSRHMEYHNKHKPLQCKLCSRFFHFESMLNKHFRTAHKLTASSFKCKFCEKVLKSLKEKWDHEWVVHNIRKTANDCELCDAKFRKYSELKRHCNDVHDLDVRSVKSMAHDSSSVAFFSL